ncbi:hypothetical protein FN976_04690 [Caenimonas sedimenti]|uniref:Uncharacterized protein n=1 Tax=Caenimonas sedimenti TaxID=2596921 RepID=A0A562ZTT4_9BURK|nr:hypothetical protein [Caenimonas sedimenti]TWO72022.1 hypothetical protein FN976_04690 [Caenimonas sedimenti]
MNDEAARASGDDPVPTVPAGLERAGDVFLPEPPSRKPWLVLTAIAVGTAAAGTILWSVLQSQRHAVEIEQLRARSERERASQETRQRAEVEARSQGESALAMLGSALYAPAAAALARLGPAAQSLDGGVYAQAARFLVPRLVTFDEAAKSLLPGDAARWRDSNLVRGLDGALQEVPGRPIAAHLFSPAGSELLIVDADQQAWVYRWPSLATAGPHALGAVCVDSLDILPDGRFAVDTGALRSTGDAEPSAPPPAGSAVRIVLGLDGRPSAPVARETSAVSRCAASSGKRGQETAVRAAPLRRLQFPRLRDEAAFWRPSPRRDAPTELPAVLPLDIRPRAPYGELDPAALPGTAEERTAIQRHLGDEALTTGLVRAEGRSIALSLHITSTQATALNLCEFEPASRKLTACGMVAMPAGAVPLFSPDHRRALLTTDTRDDPFRLFNIVRLGERCKVAQPPGERVDTAAFNTAGDRLAVVTMSHELWSYEVTAACEVRLVLRQALPALREGTRSSLAWIDPATVIWVAGQGEVFALDARSGLLRWSQHSLWPLAGRGVQVRASADGKLVVLFDHRHVQLASAANGVALSGLLEVRTLKSAEQKAGGDICDAELANTGEIRLRVQAGTCSETAAQGEARTDWRRLAPDDPQLGLDTKPGLWRRTAISEGDGRAAVPLQELLR